MGLFTFNINYVVDEETKNDIRDIKKTQEKIMEVVDQLKQTVTELRTSVDTFQELAINKVADLNVIIEGLQGQIANGPTVEKLQEILDIAVTAKNDLESTTL